MAYTDETLIAALISSPTLAQAAKKAGCHRSTLSRRMTDADFTAKLATAKKDYLRMALAGSVARQQLAVDALVDIIEGNPSDAIRLRAADILLKNL